MRSSTVVGKLVVLAAATLMATSAARAEVLTCDLAQYKSSPGLSAEAAGDSLAVTWAGDGESELRLRFVIDRGVPTIRELSLKRKAGPWVVLGTNLTPEFRVVSGFRRLPLEQIEPLLDAGVKITPEVVEQNKWEAFWDAPLRVPGLAAGPNAANVMSWMPAPRRLTRRRFAK